MTRVIAAAILFMIGFNATKLVCAQESEPKKLDAKGWMQRGDALVAEQRYPLALACFTNAIETDPDCAEAYFSRSSIYAGQNRDYAGAVADLTQYLRLRPTNYSALFNRGLYRIQTRDFDGAIADYTKVLDPSTDFSSYGGSADEAKAHALHYRGRAYHWHKNDPAKAIDDYNESIKLDPDVDRLYYRRAVAHQQLKHYREADRDFKEAYEREPDFHQLRNAWAWQLATCPEKKYRNGKRALVMAKQNDTIAAAYAEMGYFDHAIEYQQKAILNEERIQSGAEKPDDARLLRLKKDLAVLKSKQPIRDERSKDQ